MLRGRGFVLDRYDTAQVCGEGHLLNAFAGSRPENNVKHCSQCGAVTLTTCPSCREPIRGYHFVGSSRGNGAGPDEPPSYCHNCGKPYPWVEKRLAVASAIIEEMQDLTDSEKEELSKSLSDLVRDVPATELAVLRFKKYLPKAGAAVYNAFKSVMISVATDEVKRKLFGL